LPAENSDKGEPTVIKIDQEAWYSINDIAELFDRHPGTIWSWILAGVLDKSEMTMVRGRWYMKGDKLKALFEKGTPPGRVRKPAKRPARKKPKKAVRKRRAAKP